MVMATVNADAASGGADDGKSLRRPQSLFAIVAALALASLPMLVNRHDAIISSSSSSRERLSRGNRRSLRLSPPPLGGPKSTAPRVAVRVDGGALITHSMDVYPNYEGDIHVNGSVAVSFPGGGTRLTFDLGGLEANCRGCGVHVHEGKSCRSDEVVGGHYWDDEAAQDPWTADNGAAYDSDASGRAEGNFTVTSGRDTYARCEGHAVVVHASDGTKIACGVLIPDGQGGNERSG